MCTFLSPDLELLHPIKASCPWAHRTVSTQEQQIYLCFQSAHKIESLFVSSLTPLQLSGWSKITDESNRLNLFIEEIVHVPAIFDSAIFCLWQYHALLSVSGKSALVPLYLPHETADKKHWALPEVSGARASLWPMLSL